MRGPSPPVQHALTRLLLLLTPCPHGVTPGKTAVESFAQASRQSDLLVLAGEAHSSLHL